MVKFENFTELISHAKLLEQQLADLLRDSIGAVRDGARPRPPPEPEPKSAEPSINADPAHHGFQNPAPPDAPKLEAEILTPLQAQMRLLKYTNGIRQFGDHMHNVAKLSHALADVLERGRASAVGSNTAKPPSRARAPRSRRQKLEDRR